MNSLRSFTCLVLLSLSAVAFSGCTRFDARNESERSTGLEANPVAKTDTLETALLRTEDLDATLRGAEPNPPEHPASASAAAQTAQAEAVFDELETTLQELEALLGSTEDWDGSLP